MNSLKSLAMNCGPLSEMMRGFSSGYFSLARCRITSMTTRIQWDRNVADSHRNKSILRRLSFMWPSLNSV